MLKACIGHSASLLRHLLSYVALIHFSLLVGAVGLAAFLLEKLERWAFGDTGGKEDDTE